MKLTTCRFALTAMFAFLYASAPAQAQEARPHVNVISANPFGLLLAFFNIEYERIIGESFTMGIGGSTISVDDENDVDGVDDDERYINADVFFRLYPSARTLEGWAFGVKLGVTDVTDAGTYAGFGFDVNHSWLLGRRDNFYVGIGFGLKRLLGAGDEVDLAIIPTFRIINVGVAF